MRDIIDVIQEQTKLPDPILITDVGAMNIGGTERWQKLLDRGLSDASRLRAASRGVCALQSGKWTGMPLSA